MKELNIQYLNYLGQSFTVSNYEYIYKRYQEIKLINNIINIDKITLNPEFNSCLLEINKKDLILQKLSTNELIHYLNIHIPDLDTLLQYIYEINSLNNHLMYTNHSDYSPSETSYYQLEDGRVRTIEVDTKNKTCRLILGNILDFPLVPTISGVACHDFMEFLFIGCSDIKIEGTLFTGHMDFNKIVYHRFSLSPTNTKQFELISTFNYDKFLLKLEFSSVEITTDLHMT